MSLDAYHYFGTADLYLDDVARFLRPGGEIGIVCPGFRRELGPDGAPAYLASYLREGAHSFHAPAWWRDHWRKSGVVEVTCADEPPEADAIWEEFIPHTVPEEQAVIRDDAAGERLLTFSRVVARKR